MAVITFLAVITVLGLIDKQNKLPSHSLPSFVFFLLPDRAPRLRPLSHRRVISPEKGHEQKDKSLEKT